MRSSLAGTHGSPRRSRVRVVGVYSEETPPFVSALRSNPGFSNPYTGRWVFVRSSVHASRIQCVIEEHTSSRNFGRILNVRLECEGKVSQGRPSFFFSVVGVARAGMVALILACCERAGRSRTPAATGSRSAIGIGRCAFMRRAQTPLRRRSLSTRPRDPRTHESYRSEARASSAGAWRSSRSRTSAPAASAPDIAGIRRLLRGPARRPVSAHATRRRPGVLSVTWRETKGPSFARPVGPDGD